MLDAIRAARISVNLETYIFEPAEIAERFIDALVERACNGVEVRLVLDSIGSSRMGGHPVRRLRRAGATCLLSVHLAEPPAPAQQPHPPPVAHRRRRSRIHRRRRRRGLAGEAGPPGAGVA